MTHAPIRKAFTDADDVQPRLGTLAAMQKRTGLSRSTVLRLLDTGAIEQVYVGSRRMIVMASLEAYIDALPTQRRA